MTVTRGKRLRALEQEHAERERARWEALVTRGMRLMTIPDLKDFYRYLSYAKTPRGREALERLQAWEASVPEVWNLPDLGAAGAEWQEATGDERPEIPPVASPEALADLEQCAEQRRAVAARPDCPQREAAAGMVGLWAWWVAFARATHGEEPPKTEPPTGDVE